MTSRCLLIISIYDSPNAVLDERLFQLSGEKGCLFTTSMCQGTKKCMLPTALVLCEDTNYRSVLALEVQGFSQGLLSMISKRFVKMGTRVYYRK